MRVGGVEGAKQKNPLNCRIRGVPSFTLLLWLCERLLKYICASLSNNHTTVAGENTVSQVMKLICSLQSMLSLTL